MEFCVTAYLRWMERKIFSQWELSQNRSSKQGKIQISASWLLGFILKVSSWLSVTYFQTPSLAGMHLEIGFPHFLRSLVEHFLRLQVCVLFQNTVWPLPLRGAREVKSTLQTSSLDICSWWQHLFLQKTLLSSLSGQNRGLGKSQRFGVKEIPNLYILV